MKFFAETYKIKLVLTVSFLLVCTFLHGQLEIHVIDKSNSASKEDLYLAGNINGWKPGDEAYKLTQTSDGNYHITLSPPNGKLEFKFTRGSWSTVEGNGEGKDIKNRVINYSGQAQKVELIIHGWKAPKDASGTTASNVTLVYKDFHMPQLDRKRNIWIYLPPDYKTSKKSYPVLYMHDGQNLFDTKTSFLGEWEVDESLNELFEQGDQGVIVVGIENGQEHRMDEYSPWTHTQYGGGEGKAYTEFIVNTLKPFIDQNFRTKTDRNHTAIMGSSMGGLISLYAAIQHQDVFGKAGVLSPSLWFSEEVYSFAASTPKTHDMKIFFLGGELESETLIAEMDRMVTTLMNVGFDSSEIKMVTHEDGSHNEGYWSREFKDCYLWLFTQ